MPEMAASLVESKSLSATNIERLTSIPVGGNVTRLSSLEIRQQQETSKTTKDKGWAWAVCGGSFFTMFLVYGIHTSFGVILNALLVHFKESKAKTAWIGSISITMLFMFSPVTSRLVEHFGVKQVTMLGGILMSVGLLLTSFSADLLFMYLSYGVLFGIGTSMCATMALIVTADYFEKHLSLATGIAASGGSIGTLVLAPTLQALFDSYGWKVTFRIMAIGGLMLTLTGLIYKSSSRGRIVLEDPFKTEATETPNRTFALLDLTVMKNHSFVLWTVALTTAGVGYYLPHFFLIRYSEDLGINSSRGSWLISYLGIASAFGRIIFGRLSDICCVKTLHVYRTCMFLSCIASIACIFARTYEHLVIYAVSLGLLDGSYVGLMSIVTLDLAGIEKIAPAWGILFFCQSFAYLVGPPAAGLLYDQQRNFKPVFYLAAGPMGIGALMLFLVPYFKPDDVNSFISHRKEETALEKSKESLTNITQSTQLQSMRSSPNVILMSSCSNCREKKTDLLVVDRITSV